MLFMLFFLCLVFSGCKKNITVTNLGPPGENPVPQNLTLDRQGAWAAVAMTQLDAEARIKEAEADAEMARADQKRYGASEQIIIDSPADLAIYREIKRDEMLMEMSKQNARIAEAALKALQPNQVVQLPPQPKSAIAEVIDSTGRAVKSVVETPTFLAGTVGHFISAVDSGDTYTAGDNSKISGGNMDAPESTTTTTSTVETITEEGE